MVDKSVEAEAIIVIVPVLLCSYMYRYSPYPRAMRASDLRSVIMMRGKQREVCGK